MKDRVKVWLSMSLEDLEVGELTFSKGKYMHSVFMCQQAIEKAMKAVYVHFYDTVPPRKHDLLSLAKDAGIYNELKRSEWKQTLARLSSMYILSRYPDSENSFNFNKDKVKEILSITNEVISWLKTKMK